MGSKKGFQELITEIVDVCKLRKQKVNVNNKLIRINGNLMKLQ